MMQNEKTSVLLVVALVCFTGCLYPHKVTLSGPILSADSIAFLNLKDATRGETIATLGPPVWESTNSRVLLYLSQTTVHWTGEGISLDAYDDPNGAAPRQPYRADGNGDAKLKALFVAYNEREAVTSHAVRTIRLRDGSYEDLCEQYAHRATKP